MREARFFTLHFLCPVAMELLKPKTASLEVQTGGCELVEQYIALFIVFDLAPLFCNILIEPGLVI